MATERFLLLAFFSGVESGLLASPDDGEDGGGFSFCFDVGWEGTGIALFFGTVFAEEGIGALFFGTVWGEDGADLNAAGVGVGFGVSFLLAVAGTTEGGEVEVGTGS